MCALVGSYLSHVLLSCEHQLMIYDPSGVLLKQTAVGVDVDHLLVLGSAVAILGQAGSMIEEA